MEKFNYQSIEKYLKGYTQSTKQSNGYYGPIFFKALDGKIGLQAQVGLDYTLTSFLMSLEARLINEKIIKPGEICLVEKI